MHFHLPEDYYLYHYHYYLHQRGSVFTCVLGLLVRQQDYTKTAERISHETWMKDGSLPRLDPVEIFSLSLISRELFF